jgi:AAA family ATP:ADP antiporter
MCMVSFLRGIVRPFFGEFEVEEFKKFVRMGFIFSVIIGSFWTIGTLRNALFVTYVGITHIPYAKTMSLLLLIPAIVLYTKLLDWYGREKVFYLFATIAALAVFVFGILFYCTQGIVPIDGNAFSSWAPFFIGYAFFFFVEWYGLLMTTLFWAIASDTTLPASAQKGFSLVVALGQLGGIVGPYCINSLPRRLGLSNSALSLFIVAVIIGSLVVLMKNFFKNTPKELLVSYHGVNEKDVDRQQEAGFFEGLQLLVKHTYLLGIAAIIIFPEIITTIFDLHFHSLAAQQYAGVDLVEYFGAHGSTVNMMTLLFLLCGISNITRLIGLTSALLLMPIVYGAAIFGFITLNSLPFLFLLMASSKAINYALNGPAIKQLYIPTTYAVRFKTRAWMETFGSRGAREIGALFNMLLGPLQKNLGEIAGRARHALLGSYFGFAIVFVWIFIALFLGKKYNTAIEKEKVIC